MEAQQENFVMAVKEAQIIEMDSDEEWILKLSMIQWKHNNLEKEKDS